MIDHSRHPKFVRVDLVSLLESNHGLGPGIPKDAKSVRENLCVPKPGRMYVRMVIDDLDMYPG